jgi:hypothetical protein
MSDQKKYEIAKQYVDAQLNVMKGFGAAPKSISEKEYQLLIERIAQTIKHEPKKAGAAAH